MNLLDLDGLINLTNVKIYSKIGTYLYSFAFSSSFYNFGIVFNS